MSGGIESMHEDEGSSAPGDPRRSQALLKFYSFAKQAPLSNRADLALELCHQLIIELENHIHLGHRR